MRLYIFFKGLPHYRVPFLRELARALPEGWKLVVFSGRYETPEMSGYNLYEAQGFELRLSAGSLLGRGFVHWGLLREALFGSGDVYVMPGNAGFLAAYPALLALRLRGKRALIWTRGFSKNPLEGLLVRLSRGVITYGKTSKEYFERRYPRPVFVAWNAVDTQGLARRAEEFRKRGLEFWRGKPKPWIAYVRRFAPQKGAFEAIEGFRLFGRGHMAMVGRGPLLEEAKERARGLSVTFTGFLPAEEALPIVAAADLFLQTSLPGLGVLEAMALGTPPVIADVETPEAEPVRDGETGYRYAPRGPEAVAEALRRAWEDPRRGKVGERAQAEAASRWSISRMVEGFLEALEAH